jgi:2-polyprenyl-3-methyl-5-hydroxy-6-metoxy-1,4-benzoquinol methylase
VVDVVEEAEVDFASLTQGQQQILSKGDFARGAPIVQVVADRLVESVDVLPGDRVLCVACGSGNTAIAAARCFAEVTAIDFVPALLERGPARLASRHQPQNPVIRRDPGKTPRIRFSRNQADEFGEGNEQRGSR